jgi:trans-2,3-dihydro-3-hydroxyanthranilate isomerase
VDDIVTTTHRPQVASVGLPFLMVELRDRSALERARANIAGMESLEAEGIWPSVHLYVRAGDAFDIRARMFAPLAGVPEDPATEAPTARSAGAGSLNAPPSGTFSWRILQESRWDARACSSRAKKVLCCAVKRIRRRLRPRQRGRSHLTNPSTQVR